VTSIGDAEQLLAARRFDDAYAAFEAATVDIRLSESVRAQAFFKLGELLEWRQTTHAQQLASEAEALLAASVQYRESARLGHAEAHAALGLLYSVAHDADDAALALLHYEAGAVGGSVAAHMALAHRYHVGRGVVTSCARALAHYRSAAQVVVDEIVQSGLHPMGRAQRVGLGESDVPPSDDERARQRDGGESSDVIEYFQYSSDRSDASALLTLGLLYLQGTPTVRRDFARALAYFTDAAALETPASAKAMLGFMYKHGYGVKRSRRRALELWNDALADDGANIDALSFIGVDHARHGAYAKARDILNNAASRGSPAAQIELAHIYYEGVGIARHDQTAFHLYSQAAKAGFLEATFMLAEMHAHGHGTPRSCSTAVQFYKKVAEKGLRRDLLEPPYQCHVAGDEWCALHGYELAAEYGFEVAQSNAANLLLARRARLEAAGASADEIAAVARRARVRLIDAAEQNSAVAHRLLGDMYADGRGIDGGVSYERAVAFYDAASARRDAEATFRLGYMHHHGLGLAADAHLAKRYYDLAVQLDPRAGAASFFALLVLGADRGWAHLQLMTSPEYDGIDWGMGHEYRANWDTLLIAVLTVLLLFVLCVRRFCL
jgi:SEL1 protein